MSSPVDPQETTTLPPPRHPCVSTQNLTTEPLNLCQLILTTLEYSVRPSVPLLFCPHPSSFVIRTVSFLGHITGLSPSRVVLLFNLPIIDTTKFRVLRPIPHRSLFRSLRRFWYKSSGGTGTSPRSRSRTPTTPSSRTGDGP